MKRTALFMGFIYKITSPSCKVYVGKTYHLKHRIASHKYSAKEGKNIILHHSIRKYGWDNHILEVIEELEDECLNEREIFWISELRTYCYENKGGMNMTKGGEGQRSTWMHDTERREKASVYFSEHNPFQDKKHSEKTKRIIGEKARLRNKETGRKVPEWGAEKGRIVNSSITLVYNSNGLFLGEFESETAAGLRFNTDQSCVNLVVTGKQPHSKGFVFIKKTVNDYPLKIDVSGIQFKNSNDKRSVLIVDELNNIIGEFESIGTASKITGVKKNQVDRAARGFYKKTNKRNGYNFIYKDLYLSQLKTA